MIMLTNPSMSYAELTLPLPEAPEIWMATSASEWKSRYIEKNSRYTKRIPSVGDLFHDIHHLNSNDPRLDTQYCISIYLHAFWSLILEYRQLSTVSRSRSYANSLDNTPNVVLGSRYSELVKDLQNFHRLASHWQDMSPREQVLLNLLMLNLHVSLEDIYLFTGKDGLEEARQIYPILADWITSTEARSALWCAGQIVRHARLFPQGRLKDFYAMALYQAALTLWVFGVINIATGQSHSSPYGRELVYLDAADTLHIQRFIGLGQGVPAINGSALGGEAGGTQTAPRAPIPATPVLLDNPQRCMQVINNVLSANHSASRTSNGYVPALVENVGRLIDELEDGAQAAIPMR